MVKVLDEYHFSKTLFFLYPVSQTLVAEQFRLNCKGTELKKCECVCVYTFSVVNAWVLRGHCDILRNFLTLSFMINCGHFQALIAECWHFGNENEIIYSALYRIRTGIPPAQNSTTIPTKPPVLHSVIYKKTKKCCEKDIICIFIE